MKVVICVICIIFLDFAVCLQRSPSFIASSAKLYASKRSKNEIDDFGDEFEVIVEDSENTSPKSFMKRKVSIFQGLTRWENINRALLAGVFIAGIGAGITIDSAVNTNPKDLASRDAIDRNAPNPKLCATFGSSAMALDQRVFVTFNPFNVYVTQGSLKFPFKTSMI